MIEIKVLASGSRGNCYWVTDGSTPLLLECGIPWKQIQQALNFRTYDIEGCLISHEHKDHSKSWFEVAKNGIDIYTSSGTLNQIAVEHGHRFNIVKSKEQFTIGTWTVLPFDTRHDAAEPLGFLLVNKTGDKLLFVTDTYYIPYRFNGLTHIMVECNHANDILRANVDAGIIAPELKNRIIQSHMSLETAKDFFKANNLSKVQEIHLIHLSDDNSDADRFKKEIMELTGKPTFIA